MARFALRTAAFNKVVENWKNRKWTEWPQNYLKHSKRPYTHQILTPEGRILVSSLYNQPFSRYKAVEIEKHQKCTKWPWTLNSQEHPTYNRCLHPEDTNLVPFALRPAVFQHIAHCIIPQMATILYGKKRTKKNCQNPKFRISQVLSQLQ